MILPFVTLMAQRFGGFGSDWDKLYYRQRGVAMMVFGQAGQIGSVSALGVGNGRGEKFTKKCLGPRGCPAQASPPAAPGKHAPHTRSRPSHPVQSIADGHVLPTLPDIRAQFYPA